MLTITIPASEFFDEAKSEFVYTKPVDLQLEHSLISLSKWESAWGKPFLAKNQTMTPEQTLDYFKCMTITRDVDPKVYLGFSNDIRQRINEYIAAPMTATTFNERESKTSGEVITSEIIYYWMVTYQIPFECQKWHLNRLLALIKVCSIKNSSPKKMSFSEMASQVRSQNAARRAKFNSKG